MIMKIKIIKNKMAIMALISAGENNNNIII